MTIDPSHVDIFHISNTFRVGYRVPGLVMVIPMKNTRGIMVGLLGVIFLSGCTAMPIVQTPLEPIRYIDPGPAMMLVTGREYLLGRSELPAGFFVDTRARDAYETGHIPSAMHLIKATSLEEYITELLVSSLLRTLGEVLLVYGENYHDCRAEEMAQRLMLSDGARIYVIRGGMKAWKAAGYPIEKDLTDEPDS